MSREEFLTKRLAERGEEVERLRAEVSEWRDCALYDPMMEGPRFKGWNRSRLDQCRRTYIETK